MKRITRLISTVVAVLFIFSVASLTGCNKTDNKSKVTTTEASVQATTNTNEVVSKEELKTLEVKLSVWDIQNSFPEGKTDEIATFVQDKFKIKIIPVNVGWGDADEKYNTWAASGQLPDLIGGVAHVGSSRYFQWINDGVVKALPSDLSKYPEIDRLIKQPEVSVYAVEGKNYFLPRQAHEKATDWAMNKGIIVRKDWMEKVGITDPKTEEDYIQLATAFVKQDPDGNGKDDTAGYTPMAAWSIWSQGWPGFGYTDGLWMLDNDGKYRMQISGEKTFRLMKFMKRMYQAGGLDPDFATLESNQGIEKFAAGKTGIFTNDGADPKHMKAIMDLWTKAQPDKKFVDCVKFIYGPQVEVGYTRFVEKNYWSESYFNANIDDAKMDRILQLYDWLYSKEGMSMMMYGVEGKDWESKNGKITLLTPIDESTGEHVSTSVIYPFTYAMSCLAAWSADLLMYENPNMPEDLLKLTIEERDYRAANFLDPKVNWSIQAINVPEKEEMASVKFGDDWVKFIMDKSGKTDDAIYAEMKSNWDANGYKAAVEAITKKAGELGIK